jgi:hypothetical protein
VANLYLCSFASSDLKNSSNRFLEQSRQMDLYENIKIFNWDDLSLDKKKQIQSFLKKNKRLFGYACWKPEIILNFLNDLPKDSILQYSDIGCHFNKSGLKRFNDYLDIMKENNILAFQYNKPNFQTDKKLKYQIYYEHEYTKKDLFNYFKISNTSSISKSEQVWSGTIFFKNNIETKNFLNKWLEVCNHSNLIDDSPSIEKNSEKFIEHRHDQSAFSILCKLNNVVTLSASECEWAEDQNGRYWDHLKNYPILAKRDKQLNLFKRFFARQYKNIRRIINK